MRKKIGLKLIIAVSVTVFVTISIYACLNIFSQSDVLLAEVERHAIQQSETVKNSTRYGMLLNQREYIHQIINTIGAQPSIQDVRILNKEGRIIYSSKRADIGHMVDKNAESCYGCHQADKPIQRLAIEDRTRIFRLHPDSARILGVINPIYTETSCWNAECHAHAKEQSVLGVLDVTISLAEADRQIRNSGDKVTAFAFITMIAIGLIISFFVRKWVDTPVNELVKATKQVADGNLSYTINVSSEDELGELEKSFNMMTQKLAEAKQQVVQSDKMASLGRLAAGVAHEINNPLTGVLTYSSYLLKRAETDRKLKEDLEVIVREAKRSREIVKSLLDFSRQSAPRKEHTDINEVINKALQVVDNHLSMNKIKVKKNLRKSFPRVLIDSNQFQQVFINLLMNSIDAIGSDGGSIKINGSLLNLSPYGTVPIKNATCPSQHNLMDNELKIGLLPSVRVKAKTNGNEGHIHIDPIYGKHRNVYAIPTTKGIRLQLFCPECDVSLLQENKKCPECASPVYALHMAEQGILNGCTKIGCDWQEWAEVDSRGEKQFIEISFIDTGCGINEADLEKIFDPFFSTKGQIGTGLGLSVVWGIVDNHGGSIHVKSTPGEGSIFSVMIPV